MANWKNEINLSDIMSAAKDGSASPAETALKIGEKVRALKLAGPGASAYQGELEVVADNFTAWGEENSESDDFDEIDGLLNELYDLGDIPLTGGFNGAKLIWIKTF